MPGICWAPPPAFHPRRVPALPLKSGACVSHHSWSPTATSVRRLLCTLRGASRVSNCILPLAPHGSRQVPRDGRPGSGSCEAPAERPQGWASAEAVPAARGGLGKEAVAAGPGRPCSLPVTATTKTDVWGSGPAAFGVRPSGNPASPWVRPGCSMARWAFQGLPGQELPGRGMLYCGGWRGAQGGRAALTLQPALALGQTRPGSPGRAGRPESPQAPTHQLLGVPVPAQPRPHSGHLWDHCETLLGSAGSPPGE